MISVLCTMFLANVFWGLILPSLGMRGEATLKSEDYSFIIKMELNLRLVCLLWYCIVLPFHLRRSFTVTKKS